MGKDCPTIFGNFRRGFSSIGLTASVSVAALILAVGWQILLVGKKTASQESATSRAETSSESGDIRRIEEDRLTDVGNDTFNQMLGSYITMKQSGTYSEEQAQRITNALANDLRAEVEFEAVLASEIKTENDTSYQRVLAYREKLREALAPLLENRGSELEIFARFVESGDEEYLNELRKAAARYKKAASQTKALSVPKDAVTHHVAAVNSLLEFAATLENLVSHASDSMATLALLRSFNVSEASVLTSFNALALYQKSKLP